MVKKRRVLSAAIAFAAAAANNNNAAQAFQPARHVALSPASARRISNPSSTSTFRPVVITNSNHRRERTSITMATGGGEESATSSSPPPPKALFRSTSQRTRRALRRLRRSFTVLVASLAFFVSSTRVIMHAPPAHAATSAAAYSTLSLTQRLNPFRTRTADEMIDAYVRDRLFADDAYDPVESAYREALADHASGGRDGPPGAYPTLLAETAGSALGQSSKSVSSLLSSSGASSAAARGVAGTSSSSSSGGKNDGITAVLIKSSDFLQARLGVSASMSYYVIAAVGIVGICVLPGMLGVLYQGIQRLQLDKSEMKMYGKISDLDATSKKVTDEDDDDKGE